MLKLLRRIIDPGVIDLHQEGSQEIIRSRRTVLRLANVVFGVYALTSMAVLGGGGWAGAVAHDSDAGIGHQLLGVILGIVPALALLGIGHFTEENRADARLPYDTDDDHDADDVAEQRASAESLERLGWIIYFGAAVYAFSHLWTLVTETTGNERLLGIIPAAIFAPFCLEGFGLFLVRFKRNKSAELTSMTRRAIRDLSKETEARLAREKTMVKVELARLQGEAEATEMRAETGRLQRQAEQAAEVEEEAHRAGRKSRKVWAKEQAEQIIEVDKLELEATLAERRFAAGSRIADLAARADAHASTAQARAEHEMTVALDGLALDRDRHGRKNTAARDRAGLNEAGDVDPKAEATSVLHTAALNGAGHVNGTTGAS